MGTTFMTGSAAPPTEAVPHAISATGVVLAHRSKIAVRDASFSVLAGTTTAVIGPNGSGKSTLLRAIAGLMATSSGVLDVPARSQRGGVAFVLQTTDVDKSLPLTVRDTVRLARYPGVGLFAPLRTVDRDTVDHALERLDITDLAGQQLHELSGGQRQRVLVAQGIAQGAPLLLLDEPITGLDVISRQRILEVMADEHRAGTTVVLSTHSLEDARRCDAVLLLATRQVAFGSPNEVLTAGPLGEAFGGRVLHLGDGTILVDDPHHDHHDDDHRAHGQHGHH